MVVTVLVIGGTIYATEKAKEQFAALVVDVAMRDGAASRVAFEALGADKDALAALRRRQQELFKAGGEPSRQAFEDGAEKDSARTSTSSATGEMQLSRPGRRSTRRTPTRTTST